MGFAADQCKCGGGRKVTDVYTRGEGVGMQLRVVFPRETLGSLGEGSVRRSRSGSSFSAGQPGAELELGALGSQTGFIRLQRARNAVRCIETTVLAQPRSSKIGPKFLVSICGHSGEPDTVWVLVGRR